MNKLFGRGVLSEENRRWLRAFRARHGRRPRILHIGNIANNAYNNAKLLNEAGFDCDVLCHNYYHIMGCPEWEDADFTGQPADQFRPDWRSLDLHGFRRPQWFVQGSVETCLQYLIAHRSGNHMLASELWHKLAEESHYDGFPDRLSQRLSCRALDAARSAWRMAAAKRIVYRALTRLARLFSVLGARFRSVARRLLSTPAVVSIVPRRLVALSSVRRDPPARSTTPIPEPVSAPDWTDRLEELIQQFKVEFPERPDALCDADLAPYRWPEDLWNQVFAYYDVIQGYSTDPIRPLLGRRPYFAFEHGTLRDIPLEHDARGRITLIGYRCAEHVFVTNFDCLHNAQWIAGRDRVTTINHPYDEDHGWQVGGWQSLRSKLRKELDAELLVFFPTRHDWILGRGYADKANDVFLRAFGRLRREGYRVGLVLCDWGSNTEDSRQLIAEFGCSQYVRWEQPMGIVCFVRMARACHLVADQFKLGAFGGITLKAMAAGAPICTYLDEMQLLRQYPEVPPVLNCKSEDDIYHALHDVLLHPEQLARLGRAARAWMKRHHGKQEVVNAQIVQYRKLLERSSTRNISCDL